MTYTPNKAGLAAVVGEIVDDAAKFCASETRRNIKSLGAVRTGRLLRGVKLSPAERAGTSISRTVYNDTFYASFVEFGSGGGAPVPAMEQARQATEKKYR